MERSGTHRGEERLVYVPAGTVTLEGNLSLPEGARGVVLFAHGSGSSRHSSRNRYVARLLNQAGLATLLVDLLTADEEVLDLHTARLRFDIALLAERLIGATDWLAEHPDTRISAPAPGLRPRWWRPPSGPRRWVPSSRAAAAPIWPGRPCRRCGRRRCSSSAATTSR